jgi:hypothetical protein
MPGVEAKSVWFSDRKRERFRKSGKGTGWAAGIPAALFVTCATEAGPSGPAFHSTRQGETFDQLRSASFAHAVVLSVWHVVHGFGTLS